MDKIIKIIKIVNEIEDATKYLFPKSIFSKSLANFVSVGEMMKTIDISEEGYFFTRNNLFWGYVGYDNEKMSEFFSDDVEIWPDEIYTPAAYVNFHVDAIRTQMSDDKMREFLTSKILETIDVDGEYGECDETNAIDYFLDEVSKLKTNQLLIRP
jgi:hypothetical protein